MKDKEKTPVLFTLRWKGATEDLTSFVERLSRQKPGKERLVLLVDGYDEISDKERQQVSRTLLLFQSLQRGPFLLTCRTFYDVYDLKCDYYEIERFTEEDALRFIEAFCAIYDVDLNARALIAELNSRGFKDFVTHPLMLTLVCILKTGPNQDIPRRAIGLIRRAIEVLTFRWDQEKRVARKSYVPLDGEERVRCLMRIAFYMKSHQSSYDELIQTVRGHLSLIQLSKVDPAKLLDELAQWYGIVIPVEQAQWQFVHRTIHDFLAARFWVESGSFTSQAPKEWNTRAAYAVCLLPDATEMLVRMLTDGDSLEAFSECLYNKAPFDTSMVANAVIQRAWRKEISVMETEKALQITYHEDPFHQASPDFLRKLVMSASSWSAKPYNGLSVACCALAEMRRREITIERNLVAGRLGDLIDVNPVIAINGLELFRLQDAIT